MNGCLIGVVCFVLVAYTCTSVDGQATDRDVNMLQGKIDNLKRLINQTNAEIRRAKELYEIFLDSAVKISSTSDTLFVSSQKHCDSRTNQAKRFVNSQARLVEKMLKSRSNKVHTGVKSAYDKSRKDLRSMLTALKSTVTLGKNITNMNKELSKETEQHTKTIKIALQEQNLDDVQEDLFLANRQIQLVQFSEFERTRSDGYSGIKQIKSNSGMYFFMGQYIINKTYPAL